MDHVDATLLTLAGLLPADCGEQKPPYFVGDGIGPKEERQRRLAAGDKTYFYFGHQTIDEMLSSSAGLYAWTTENIREYLPALDVAGKRCLTVASSGDHIINLLMAGATEVVSFDNVETAGAVSSFKMQALADLTWRDSQHFRGSLWEEALTPIMYARLEDRCAHPLYSQSRSLLRGAVSNMKSPASIFKAYQTSGRNPYIADETSFAAAKAACHQAMDDGRVSFVHADIRDLPLLELGKFDVIVLSNILQSQWKSKFSPTVIARGDNGLNGRDFLHFSPESLKALIDMMVWPTAQLLAPGGVMMASYTYACPSDEWEEIYREECEEEGETYRPDPLANHTMRQRAFTPPDGFSVSELRFDVVNGEASGNDVAVLIQRDR
jgi:hypothetical protein